MERVKRVVSLILCFVMVFGLLPMHAFAAEGETEPVNDTTNQVAPIAETSDPVKGNLVGSKVYTLDTNGISADKDYLIVNTRPNSNTGTGSALTNKNGSVDGTSVTIVRTGSYNNYVYTISVEDDTNIAWQFSDTSSGSVGNNGRYVYPGNGSLSLNENGSNLAISNQTNGAYRIYRDRSSGSDYYLRYNNSAWTGSTNQSNVYLYELTSSNVGSEVVLTVTPGSAELKVEDTQVLIPAVTVAGNPATNYTITWDSSNKSVATVSNNGTVTAVGEGTTNITATLTAVGNTAVANNGITVTIPVSVTDVELTGITVEAPAITTCVHKAPDFSGVKVIASYSDGTTNTMTEGFTISDYTNEPGEQTVTVEYEDKTATFTITVEDHDVTGRTLIGPTEFSFVEGTFANFSALAMQYTYECGCITTDSTGLSVSGYNINEPGSYPDCPVMLNGEQVGKVNVVVTENVPVTGNGNLVGSYVYTLDTDGINAGEKYLIVSASSSSGYALTNNNTNSGTRTQVTISNRQITVTDDTNIAWVFSGTTSGTVKNGNRYIYMGSSSSLLSTSSRTLTFSNRNNGAYYVYYNNTSIFGDDYYLRYSSSSWSRTTNATSVYLYRQTDSTLGAPVTFTIDRDSVNLKPGESTLLNATVTLNGREVDLDDCEIAWTSSNDYASVNSGTVTGRAEGTAIITATLTEVDGEELATPIALNVTVKVQNLAVVSAYLTGNSPITTTLDVAPNYSNIKYVIVYEDGSQKVIPASELVFGTCDVSTSGNRVVDIEYNGEKVGSVVVNVIVDFSKLPEADMDKAPEYPNDGAVRIDKTATHKAEEFNRTGVTRVELDVAGISVIQGVDVILVADISNSMAWKAGKKNVSPAAGETTKWQDLQAAANGFINVLLGKNEDETENTNTVSFVIFGGYDADRNANSNNYSGNFDATATVFTGYTDPLAAQDMINSYSITGNDSAGYTVTIDGEDAGKPQGGTNYDYAFNEAAAAIAQLKAQYEAEHNGAKYDDSGREIYVLFMTDGAPDHYNQLYYKTRGTGDFDYYALYFNAEDPITATTEYFDSHSLPSYRTFRQYTTNGYYIPTGSNVSNADWITWIQSDALYAAEQVMKIPRVNSITSVGFDLANGAFSDFTFGESVLTPVLRNLAGPNSCQVFTTDDSAALNQFYVNLAHDIRYAGTDAKVTDIVDQNFSVQMENNVYDKNGNPIALQTPPSITIKTYDLHPRGTIVDGENLTGKRTGVSEDIETVTFAIVNNNLQAYSNVIGAGVNILTTDANGNITISAKNFTYTKEAATSKEQFVWTIGNITDKEIALAFDAYLEGSMEGNRAEDVYYTNEEAILEYVDINGDYAKKIFPIPGVAWGGATTTIRFYLVDHEGNPVNREGEIIPWENRIYVGDPVVVALNLNADLTIDAQKIEAAAHVPAQFYLYDINAYYTVQTTSSADAIKPGITVSEPSQDAYKETGTGDDVLKQTGAQTTRVISAEEEYYTWSYVGFGVRWDMSSETTEHVLTSDQIVIDYGKAIQVDVLANDVVREEYNRELVGFIKYTAGTDLSYVMENPGSKTFTAEYGNFSIVDGKVQFQPTQIINKVQRVFYAVLFTQKTNEENSYIVWGQLDIIPATIVYYETDFATGVFTTENTWSTVVDEIEADGPQNAGTIGVNQTYGFDSTYENDAFLSNGSSLFAEGQGVTSTTVTFSFTGTGFDLISRTGALQGLINAQIATDVNMTNVVKSVSVLNKSETNLELYQIPVISVNDLPHNTYFVKIGVEKAYSNEKLPVLSRGGEFYFDAIRIYDPVEGDATAEAAYNADGEANNVIDEVRQQLISAATFEAIPSGSNTAGMVFVDRTYVDGGIDMEIGNVNVSDYATVGPNNEVYLSNGQAIAFKMNTKQVPASFDVGAKSITGGAAKLQVTITNNAGKSWTVTKDIASSTVQFIDLLSTVTDKNVFTRDVYVIITNIGEGVLSITDFKTAYSVTNTVQVASIENAFGISLASMDPNGIAVASANSYGIAAVETADVDDPYAVSYTVDGETLNVARAVLSVSEEVEPEVPETPEEPEATEPEVTEPEVTEPEETEPEVTEPEETEPEVTEPEVTEPEATEPEEEKPNYDVLRASVRVTGRLLNLKYTITAVTTQDVVDVKVSQLVWNIATMSKTYVDMKDGTRVWTIVLSNRATLLDGIYKVTGYGADGTRGASATVSIYR